MGVGFMSCNGGGGRAPFVSLKYLYTSYFHIVHNRSAPSFMLQHYFFYRYTYYQKMN